MKRERKRRRDIKPFLSRADLYYFLNVAKNRHVIKQNTLFRIMFPAGQIKKIEIVCSRVFFFESKVATVKVGGILMAACATVRELLLEF